MKNLVNWKEDYDKILPKMGGVFEMIPFRVGKCGVMYYLARKATNGVIVELGAWVGNGTAALCFGTLDGNNLPVHTVDWFIDNTGALGQTYHECEMNIFEENMKRLNLSPILHRGSFLDIGRGWELPISLMMWEGNEGPTQEELEVWEKHIISGGTISLRDTLGEALGCRPMIEGLISSGRYMSNLGDRPEVWTGGFLIAHKR